MRFGLNTSSRWMLGAAGALGCLLAGTALARTPVTSTNRQTLSFDPFTLTGSDAPSSNAPDASLSEISVTVRPPTRNPFRPPARSPFIPGAPGPIDG